MRLFQILNNKKVSELQLEPNPFKLENRDMHSFFNDNLWEIFEIRKISEQFELSSGCRLDCIGLDKNNYPIIIEYGKVRKSFILTQTLDYKKQLKDNPVNMTKFKELAVKKLGKYTPIDSSKIKILGIAPNFNDHDIRNIKTTKGDDIRFIQYRYYQNCLLLIDIIDEQYTFEVTNQLKHFLIKLSSSDLQSTLIDLHREILLLDNRIKFNETPKIIYYTLLIFNQSERLLVIKPFLNNIILYLLQIPKKYYNDLSLFPALEFPDIWKKNKCRKINIISRGQLKDILKIIREYLKLIKN